ncbi:CBN-TAG-280 protein [Caenorhabditis brenneri]|uniref:CBN-TAG-280 protein n=1 Tax=Caenorhabditis brenneri TaxID=135651 RepID=G0MUV1_CAEBE|nr:CBN-TAG-280 protein [Caenorhabditis brenneri]
MGQRQAKVETPLNEENLRKFYDTQFENQLIADNLKWAQQRAVDLLKRRDQLQWEVLAAATTTVVLLAAGSIYKRKDLIIPIVPLIMGCGYRYDVAHGDNRQLVREEAEKLLKSPNDLCLLPPISLKEIDEFRVLNFNK